LRKTICKCTARGREGEPQADMTGSEIIGIIVTIERAIASADKKSPAFFITLLEKQHTRLKTMLDRHIVSWFLASLGMDIEFHPGRSTQTD